MKLSYQANTWGGVVGHPMGVTSAKDLYYLSPGPTEQALREIAGIGYQGFELFDGNLVAYQSDKGAFRSLLAETGLQLIAVYCGGNFIYPDILPDELWRIARAATLAADFGAQHLVIGGGAVRASGTRQGDYERLADALDQVAHLASQCGLAASYHPHHGTMVETPAQIERILSLASIGFCPDTGHLLEGGGDPVAIVRRYVGRIPYVHLKDYRDGVFLPLGQGQVDIRGVIDVLEAAGYDGWFTAELDAYAGHPREAAEIAWRFLKQEKPG